MSDVMRPLPYRQLILRALAEYRKKGSIFDIPESHFWRPALPAAVRIFTSSSANPVGPAAGPHTQLAQNILASWLAGARYIELKTVQKLDELKVGKPCIDAADEGYNVEWSTELTLEGAADEYLKAWFLLHVFEALMDPQAGSAGPAARGSSFLFNMSVGYDLEGIRTEKMNRFIDRLVDASADELFQRYARETDALAAETGLLAGTPWESRTGALDGLGARIPARICGSVTLSTMHGCPPGEIEAICAYLLTEKKLDTLVKLNPTLLGHDSVRSILDSLGYQYIALNPAGFGKDLQWGDALPMLRRLLALAGKKGRHFGAKLSNTLAVGNTKKELPGDEMYMSGRALYPLTISLAARLAAELDGGLPMSFSGGVSAWNIAEVLGCGIRPVTLATDLLKPGGYSRLKQLADIAVGPEARGSMAGDSAHRVDPARTRAAAENALRAACSAKEFRGADKVRASGPLPLLDCFVAPCVLACPIGQDVPEYVHLVGAGQFEKAFDVIYGTNPLPFMTGYLCDHQCTESCTRRDWEGAVRIREVKKIAAENGYGRFVVSGVLAGRKAGPRRVKAAVLGAGPAGLAASAFLAREGFEAHVFEREAEPGGVVRWLLPGFRIPAETVEKDVALLRDLGVRFHYAERRVRTLGELARDGFRYVLVAIGAQADREPAVPGARGVLSFLREFREEPLRPVLGHSVVVVGAGDTAMDAARAAKRCAGVREVRVVYRRSRKEMPCSPEEYESAGREGVAFSFLRSPVSWSAGTLRCAVMALGEPDESGRARPVATDSFEDIPADTVISAVGAEVDTQALGDLGFPGPDLFFDPDTQETALPGAEGAFPSGAEGAFPSGAEGAFPSGVFLIGDAASGAATIVKGIASARRAADAICEREGGSHYRSRALPAEDTAALRRGRDGLIPVSAADADEATIGKTEGRRCLGCRALCVKCVEVCPNRANTIVAVAGLRDEGQIIHLDALCNECGNCATFCPWDGKPYKDKLTVFSLEEDFRASENPGFWLDAGRGLIRLAGETRDLVLDESGEVPADAAPDDVRAVVQAVVRDHSWLLGPVGAGKEGRVIILKNCTLVHLHPVEVRAGVDIRIDGTRIASVGGTAATGGRPSPGSGDRVLDLDGRIVMPGLVCGHTHFYSGLARGIMARIDPCPDFVSTLANLWWRLDRAIDGEILRASALVSSVEAIRAGCTAVIDHHASPSFIEGSLDVLRESLELTGLRGVLCYETTDRNGQDGMERGIAENGRFARRVEAERGGRGAGGLVEAMIGGHAPFTLSDQGLRSLGDLVGSTGRGFHVHAAEDSFDPSFAHRFHGQDLVARMDGFGLLARPALVAHGLYLSPADRLALNAKGAALAHNCRSNMNNSVGYNHALPELQTVVLGTDGIGADMLEETRTAYFKHRDAGGPLSPADFARFLQNGNVVLSRCFGGRFGRVEEGFAADLVVLDYDPPTPLEAQNAAGHLVFGMASAHVDTVIVNGSMVLENRRFPWDTMPAFTDAREQARRLWHRMDTL